MTYTVITGASAGIGRASALAFAARGKNLVLAARRQDRLEALKAEIAQSAPAVDVILHPVDLSLPANCTGFYEALRPYTLETWVNNAGLGVYGPVEALTESDINSMLGLNIEALTILSSLFVKDHRDTPGAQLINISSAGGYSMVQNAVTYCATKFYVSAFTEGLALELQNTGAKLQAKVLAPFLTETEFAQVANKTDSFSYSERYRKYHTSEEMAQFLLQLYDSDKPVGIVNREDHSFSLSGVRFRHVPPSM